ncbi:MAG: hypothetical protein LBI28_00900 [Treponema sp.]|jgi:hypothetical protein|nr:hypothetical protein [Treponema sp.]
MKKIILLLIFCPYIIFSQEHYNLNLFEGYSDISNNEEIGTKNNYLASLGAFTVLLADVAINVGMREGIYRNNYQDNWWGTVNGALTLGLGGTIIVGCISYGIFKISDGKFNENGVFISTFLGLAGGVTMAFFPPFYQAFRENAYLYYTYPTLFAIGMIFVIIDIWTNKERNLNLRVTQNSLIFQFSF